MTLIEEDSEIKTSSGIVFAIPDTAKDKPNRGRILAVGPKCEGLAPGEAVLFTKYGGTDFNLGDTKYVLISMDDVIAKLNLEVD